MVSIVTKKIKGKEYLYLVHSVRVGSKVVQKTVKYIGVKRFISKEEFICMKDSYEKKDWILKNFADELSYLDHEQLKNASDEYNKYFGSLDKVSKEKEMQKFLSTFIANTNAIEGSTMTVRDTYNYLFEDVLPSHGSKKELHMAENMILGWNHVENNFHRIPTHEDLFILHKLTNRFIEEDSTLGKYKKVQNYVGDLNTTSFLFVNERMDLLLSWIKKSLKKINDFEVAFQSHAQFELIHPFVDGNGRVGRLLLNWILLNKKYAPLAIKNSRRKEYLLSLRNSQRGKIEAICRFCYKEYLKQYKSAVS